MNLENLTLEELWTLFPIVFVSYNKMFDERYLTEKEFLESLLEDKIKRISHIGSTAIKNIKTKPIVDILIEAEQNDFQFIKDVLMRNDYLLMMEKEDKISFNKGYTNKGYGDKVFHIHIKEYGVCDELYFRDYLNDHYDIAKQYEILKEDLYNKYKPNRDLYTAGKSGFVEKVVELARREYKDRY